jgi:hypothetical protein
VQVHVHTIMTKEGKEQEATEYMSTSWETMESKAAAAKPKTQEYTSDGVLNQRIVDVCQSLQGTTKNKFKWFPTDKDRALVAGFLEAGLHQENIRPGTKKVWIDRLAYLCKYCDYKKSFTDMTD